MKIRPSFATTVSGKKRKSCVLAGGGGGGGGGGQTDYFGDEFSRAVSSAAAGTATVLLCLD